MSVSFCSRRRSPSAAGCASSRSDFPDSVSKSTSSSSKGQSFLLRVLRAALPVQLLLLLLIGLACLVPMTEEDYSCHHANNFARSFHPMLHYTNGPPPIWDGAAFHCFANDSIECFLFTLCPKAINCYMNDEVIPRWYEDFFHSPKVTSTPLTQSLEWTDLHLETPNLKTPSCSTLKYVSNFNSQETWYRKQNTILFCMLGAKVRRAFCP